ncbi:hypothetical protein FF38_00668, partial [Lucilia cuprina]
MSTAITTTNNSTTNTITTTTTTTTASPLISSHMNKISTSTPQKHAPDAAAVSAEALADLSGLADTETSNVFNDDTINTSSLSPHHHHHHSGSGNKLNKSTSASNSPVAKRHINSGSITRIRPQSSYSARVLIFDDSDQELGGSGSNNSNASGSGNNTHDGTTKSSTGLEMLASSPKNDSSISSSQSLLRNLNLTKSSSGGLSGSSISLPARGYGALLRKISYQQHTYSMRSSSN